MLSGRRVLIVDLEREGTSTVAHDLMERALAGGDELADVDLADSFNTATVKQRRRPAGSILALSFGCVIGLDCLIKLVVVNLFHDGRVMLDALDVHRVNVATISAITAAAL